MGFSNKTSFPPGGIRVIKVTFSSVSRNSKPNSAGAGCVISALLPAPSFLLSRLPCPSACAQPLACGWTARCAGQRQSRSDGCEGPRARGLGLPWEQPGSTDDYEQNSPCFQKATRAEGRCVPGVKLCSDRNCGQQLEFTKAPPDALPGNAVAVEAGELAPSSHHL